MDRWTEMKSGVMKLERASFLVIEDSRHVASGYKGERKRSGQIEISAPTPVVVTRCETDFLHPHPKHHAKKCGIREGNTNRHFQNVMWLKAPWVKRQISWAKALWTRIEAKVMKTTRWRKKVRPSGLSSAPDVTRVCHGVNQHLLFQGKAVHYYN